MKKHWIVTEEPMEGYTLMNILRLLIQNKFRIHVKYIPRFLFALLVSLLFLPFRVIETIRFSKRIKNTVIEKDPLFIIGYYRSGTTYLHTMFSMDKSRGYVSNTESYLPAVFLAWPKLTRAIMAASLPEQRPMDEVELTPEEPIEEEYAIGAYSKYSIYNGFVFPRNFGKIYSKYNSFDGLPKDYEKWKKIYYWFLQKMTIRHEGRQLVIKNPTASFRIPAILKMFPNAKFLHIYRDPYRIFSSNVKYHNEVFELYALQTWDEEETQETILKNYRELYEKLDRDKHLIPEDRFTEIKYEDFLTDPMGNMERVYRELDLDGFDEAKAAMQAHADAQETFKPAKHVISDDFARKVNLFWGHLVDRFGYEKIEPQKDRSDDLKSPAR